MREDTTKKYCSILFDVLEQKGIQDVVCSPGSRNVPLLIAAHSRERIRKHFVVDERSAAFVALGMSLVKKSPVAMVCTSGTALLNYAPAVAEAYYQGIPLIVISADRPLQWIDQDDSQTLRQNNILDNFVKRSYTIPALGEDDKEMQWYVNRIVNDAFYMATNSKPGPVHINVHLSEPLGNTELCIDSSQRIIDTIQADGLANKEIIRELAGKISESKILLVAGFCQPDSRMQKAIGEFCRFPNVAVMAETISNLHLKQTDYCIDSVLTAYDSQALEELAPDIIVSLGGALISRKLKEYLRINAEKCKHWSIGYSHTTSDPFMSLALRIETEPARFFRNINSALRKLKIRDKVKEYKKSWEEKREAALRIKNDFIEKSEWSELKAFEILLNSIPSDYNLFLSNGTSIRYAQIINYRLPHASYCNRGVSGIDGSLSTSIGGSVAYKGDSILISGDLSMAYDIGALGIKEIPDRFKVIVIDNNGGGIFRFIPSTSDLELREEYLCQPPLLPLKELSEGYGWEYMECGSTKDLKKILPSFFTSNKKSILRVICDGVESAGILKNYMNLKI